MRSGEGGGDAASAEVIFDAGPIPTIGGRTVEIGAPHGREKREGVDERSARGSTPLRVMTFNILHQLLNRGPEHAWAKRRDAVVATIRRSHAVIVGLQEADAVQVDFILDALGRDRWGAFGRGVGVDEERLRRGKAYRLDAALYRRDQFELIEEGERWLSEDGSPKAAWGATFPRMAVWARLRRRDDGRTLLAINVHLSHISRDARVRSAELLRERLPELARPGEAVVLTGDLNCVPSAPPFQTLAGEGAPLRDAYAETDAPKDAGTLHLFSGKTRRGWRIDHVLVAGPLRGRTARVLIEPVDGVTPSDHHPVIVELEWAGAKTPPSDRRRRIY